MTPHFDPPGLQRDEIGRIQVAGTVLLVERLSLKDHPQGPEFTAVTVAGAGLIEREGLGIGVQIHLTNVGVSQLLRLLAGKPSRLGLIDAGRQDADK